MTVREWFRLVRVHHAPETRSEEDLIQAIRMQDWRVVEFCLLRHLSAYHADPSAHDWHLEEYTFECSRCEASIPREIDETDPPAPDPTCHCRACEPCQGKPS